MEVCYSQYGLAFEVRVKGRPVSLRALEELTSLEDTFATIHIRSGPVEHRLSRHNRWDEIGCGRLAKGVASGVQLHRPVILEARSVHSIYIATDNNCGIRYQRYACPILLPDENDDLQVFAGFSFRSVGSSKLDEGVGSCHARFIGQLIYRVKP